MSRLTSAPGGGVVVETEMTGPLFTRGARLGGGVLLDRGAEVLLRVLRFLWFSLQEL